MENQPKLTSSKEVIAMLAEAFPACFCAEGETRPLKIGIFQDLVERVQKDGNLSKTQLRNALRLYTSSWRYLHGIKPGAVRVDLDGNPCGELDEQHIAYARQQLEEAKQRMQTRRQTKQQAKKPEKAAQPEQRAAADKSTAKARGKPSGKRQPPAGAKTSATKSAPAKTGSANAAPAVKTEHKPAVASAHLSAAEVAALTPGQVINVKVGSNAVSATVQEVAKEGVRVLLASGMSMIVRAEHLMF